MGIQNLASELTKPAKKTELKSEPPKSRKRPKCGQKMRILKNGLVFAHFGRFLDLGGSDLNFVFFVGFVCLLVKF